MPEYIIEKGNFKMKKKQLASFLLAMTLVSSFLFSSCSEEKPDESETGKVTAESEESSESTKSEETEDNNLYTGVTSADYGGRTFNFYCEGWYNYEPLCVNDIYAEGYTGDGMTDAVFDRNARIEKDMNCKVEQARYLTHDSAFMEFSNSVFADDKTFDIAIFRGTNTSAMLTNGYLYDLEKLNNVDLNKPWWSPEFRKALTIGGRSYATISDITTSDEDAVFCIFFNKSMHDNYQLDDLYEVVDSGKWTYDKMYEMSEIVSADLNGDGTLDYQDQYGILYTRDFGMGLLSGVQVNIMGKDENDLPVLVFNDEENITRYINVIDPLGNRNICYNYWLRGGYSNPYELFTFGQTLFFLSGFYQTPIMRDMDTDFGIIPYPKYSEEQQQYNAGVSVDYIPLCGVPVYNVSPDETGAFMDYYAYLGRTMIRPEYYDGLLSGKLTRDSESNDMLDLIFDHVTIDSGLIFNFGGFSFDLMLRFDKETTEGIASFTESYMNKISADLQEWLELVAAQDNSAAESAE